FYLVSQYDDAKNSYSAVFRHDSGGQSEEYLKARYGIGYVYFNEKDYEKALPHFRYFVDRGRSHTNYHDALVRLADCYYTTKQYDQAIATYSQVQSGTGQNQDYAAYQKGLIYGLQSRLSQADASFDLVINNHP